MADEVQRVEERTTRADDGTRTTRTVTRGRYGYMYYESPLARLIWFLGSITFLILLIRFLLALFGANRANGFADFFFTITQPLVAPFFNLFNYNTYSYGAAHVEIYTIVAMVVYLLATWAAAALASLLSPARRHV